MEAADGDSPPRTAIQILSIYVDRNLNTPIFTRPGAPSYRAEVTILETLSFQSVIYKVESRDGDIRVSKVLDSRDNDIRVSKTLLDS